MPERYIKILTDLKDLLVRHFGDEISRVTLFGSRSQDTAQEDSDYEILSFHATNEIEEFYEKPS